MTWESVSAPDNFDYPEVWRILLKEWLELIHIYSAQPINTERDVPYWYGERPLTGLLAASAWRLENGWALEEFSSLRGEEAENNTGRVDLWVGIGDNTYTMEAKLTWPEGDLNSAISRVNRRLNEARDQLLNIGQDYRQGLPVSVCYVVPWPKIEQPEVEIPRYIGLLKDLVNCFQAERCATALFIPGGEIPKEDGRAYPGVAMIARIEKWNNN